MYQVEEKKVALDWSYFMGYKLNSIIPVFFGCYYGIIPRLSRYCSGIIRDDSGIIQI